MAETPLSLRTACGYELNAGTAKLALRLLEKGDEVERARIRFERLAPEVAGEFTLDFLAGEVNAFLAKLAELHARLQGTCELTCIDGLSSITVTALKLGHIQIKGRLEDSGLRGTGVFFEFQGDPSELKMISEAS